MAVRGPALGRLDLGGPIGSRSGWPSLLCRWPNLTAAEGGHGAGVVLVLLPSEEVRVGAGANRGRGVGVRLCGRKSSLNA